MAEAGVLEQSARRRKILFLDQHAARQDAERAFEHAHILIEHEMRNGGTFEQRLLDFYPHQSPNRPGYVMPNVKAELIDSGVTAILKLFGAA